MRTSSPMENLVMKNQKGFSLVELLVVVGILGLLACVMIPNVISQVHKARQKESMANMAIISEAAIRYYQDTATLPGTAGTCDATLAAALTPKYVPMVDCKDGWGATYTVVRDTTDADAPVFIICSGGANGTYGDNNTITTCDLANYDTISATGTVDEGPDINADLMFANGAKVAGPGTTN